MASFFYYIQLGDSRVGCIFDCVVVVVVATLLLPGVARFLSRFLHRSRFCLAKQKKANLTSRYIMYGGFSNYTQTYTAKVASN
jgi:hypothetical protein